MPDDKPKLDPCPNSTCPSNRVGMGHVKHHPRLRHLRGRHWVECTEQVCELIGPARHSCTLARADWNALPRAANYAAGPWIDIAEHGPPKDTDAVLNNDNREVFGLFAPDKYGEQEAARCSWEGGVWYCEGVQCAEDNQPIAYAEIKLPKKEKP